jgi:hypothetical protein
MPDFLARMRAIFGDRVLEVSGAELIRQDRDRYGASFQMRVVVSLYCSNARSLSAAQVDPC